MLSYICGKSSGNQKSNVAGLPAMFMTHWHLGYIFSKTMLISLIFKKAFYISLQDVWRVSIVSHIFFIYSWWMYWYTMKYPRCMVFNRLNHIFMLKYFLSRCFDGIALNTTARDTRWTQLNCKGAKNKTDALFFSSSVLPLPSAVVSSFVMVAEH